MSGWGGRSRGVFERGLVAFSLSLMSPYSPLLSLFRLRVAVKGVRGSHIMTGALGGTVGG